MLIQPLHIATRGRLDGQYGIATRGYIVLPDIVPRYPSTAEVDRVGWLPVPGTVEETGFEAKVEDHGVFTLQATVEEIPGLEARADGETETLLATIGELDWEATATSSDDVVGEAGETGYDGSVVPEADLGSVDDNDSGASISDDGLIGDIDEEEPPGC